MFRVKIQNPSASFQKFIMIKLILNFKRSSKILAQMQPVYLQLVHQVKRCQQRQMVQHQKIQKAEKFRQNWQKMQFPKEPLLQELFQLQQQRSVNKSRIKKRNPRNKNAKSKRKKWFLLWNSHHHPNRFRRAHLKTILRLVFFNNLKETL